ncbi:MAG: hypothetical protein AB7O60_11900 [Variibacter sp.]
MRGAVEPPPSANAAPNTAATTSSVTEERGPFDPLGDAYTGPNPTQRVITSGRTAPAVANAPAARQRSVLDWLVD